MAIVAHGIDIDNVARTYCYRGRPPPPRPRRSGWPLGAERSRTGIVRRQRRGRWPWTPALVNQPRFTADGCRLADACALERTPYNVFRLFMRCMRSKFICKIRL
ncbi:hypothetical protein EVAR_41760_1 [Eumeta japonica]|uniref:Uncharacterized protein n=1 Tax=Eumeta variegata TaxID=151549 RepID=A0A4C1W168_EUMVA|nr:hypothetical protein EVAR_41760_1 [Eumeta japonica]